MVMNSLKILDLSYNRFEGPIPPFTTDCPIVKLLLSHNLINSPLPVEWENRYNPATYNFHHYVRRTKVSPYMIHLELIDLSYNLLSMSVNDLINPLLTLENLREVHFRGNNLTGPFTDFGFMFSYLISGVAYEGKGLEKVTLFDVVSNNITGELPNNLPVSLIVFQAQSNSFDGEIPEIYSQVYVLDLLNNQLHSENLPSFLYSDDSRLEYKIIIIINYYYIINSKTNKSYTCPGISFHDKSITIDIDYDNYKRCWCNEMYFGNGNNCTKCKDGYTSKMNSTECTACPIGEYRTYIIFMFFYINIFC